MEINATSNLSPEKVKVKQGRLGESKDRKRVTAWLDSLEMKSCLMDFLYFILLTTPCIIAKDLILSFFVLILQLSSTYFELLVVVFAALELGESCLALGAF